MSRGFDLHTHSTCSDGTTAPSRVAALASDAGLDGFALTDHDTMAGWDEAAAAAARLGLAFVPGVELSTELDGLSLHLLGYWVDRDDADLRRECERLRGERHRRAAAMVAKLALLGAPVTLSAVEQKAGEAPIGRPHVAAALVDAGHVPDLDSAFSEFLADGGPAYEPKRALSPQRGVALIRAAGGVPVLAHPGLTSRGASVDAGLVDTLVDGGLAGIEADHCGHEPEVRERWRAVARARGLVVTGSSDFHGTRKDSVVGAATTAPGALAALQGTVTRRREEASTW